VFAFKDRKPPRDRFRFIWAGASSERKGWKIALMAWEHLLRTWPHAFTPELYMKLSPVDDGQIDRRRHTVTVDNRRLSRKALAELFQSAHVGVACSAGEGWGLISAEMASTGLPLLFNPTTALDDMFSKSTGYPIPSIMTEQKYCCLENERVPMALPRPDALAALMIEVAGSWHAAKRKGIAAAEMIRSKYTWPDAGATLVRELERITTAR
jgi:glycosyltransferase involved in cell wall biosynthesis